MSQVTLYLPDELARLLKREARARGKSLSAFVTELATGRTREPGWPRGFFSLSGSCRGSLTPPEDPPPEEP